MRFLRIIDFDLVRHEGEEWVPIADVCTTLGLSPIVEIEKLRHDRAMRAKLVGGKWRVSKPSSLLWLAGLDAGSVKAEWRDGLRSFQREAAIALSPLGMKALRMLEDEDGGA